MTYRSCVSANFGCQRARTWRASSGRQTTFSASTPDAKKSVSIAGLSGARSVRPARARASSLKICV